MLQTQTKQSVIDGLLDSGMSAEDVLAQIRERAQQRNRAAQATLPAPMRQTDGDFAEREAWLHDGQPIYGEGGVKEFVHAAHRAAKAGNQLEFSRQKDLLYKAVLTFVGAPPPEDPPIDQIAVIAAQE